MKIQGSYLGQPLFLLLAYTKNEKDDLSASELKILKSLVEERLS